VSFQRFLIDDMLQGFNVNYTKKFNTSSPMPHTSLIICSAFSANYEINLYKAMLEITRQT